MVKVGLTGSIAVGKSFVCDVFRELGCHVLDADRTAREVVAPGTNGYRRVIEEFGERVVQTDGGIDRKKLGEIVFADQQKRELLNSIIHPLVIEAQNEWIKLCEANDRRGIAIVDAALMIESGNHKRFDKLVVVWCEPAIQLKRLMLRDNLSREEALQRIASQMSQDDKKRHADHLIDTSHSFESSREQTVAVFEQLRDSA